MKRMVSLAAALLCLTAMAVDAPKGTVPRETADKYPAHAEQNGVAIGVKLLIADQARHAFTTDVNRCCMVVEVALFPAKDDPLQVSLDAFMLRVVGAEDATRPSSAEVLAGKLQRQAQGPPPSPHDVTVSPTVGIGYESGGIDPVTGQRRPGSIVTSTGVGVGIGGHPESPRPGSTDADRRAMEQELSEKALPEGNATAPVAGYVYFAVDRKKRLTYQLEYTLNGEKVIVPLP
jgi:hypothetical protein